MCCPYSLFNLALHSSLTLHQSISTTITRPGEPAVSYHVMATSMDDIKEAIASELSSPITSYDFDGATLQHRQSYSVRLRVCTIV
jgi:hypothetical protein